MITIQVDTRKFNATSFEGPISQIIKAIWNTRQMIISKKVNGNSKRNTPKSWMHRGFFSKKNILLFIKITQIIYNIQIRWKGNQ